MNHGVVMFDAKNDRNKIKTVFFRQKYRTTTRNTFPIYSVNFSLRDVQNELSIRLNHPFRFSDVNISNIKLNVA